MAIDPRFLEQDSSHAEYIQRQEDESLNGVKDREGVVDALVAWIEDSHSKLDDPHEFSAWFKALPVEEKPSAWLGERRAALPDALLAALDGQEGDEWPNAGVSVFLGQALACYTLKAEPILSSCQWALGVLDALPQNAYREFEARLASGLTESDATRERFVVQLKDEIRQLNANPCESVMRGDRSIFEAEINAWHSDRCPLFRCWHRLPRHTSVRHWAITALELLLQIDVKAWCQCVQALQVQHALEDAFATNHLLQDRERLLAVIQHAPPTCLDNGTIDSEVAAFGLNAALDHVRKLLETVARAFPDTLSEVQKQEVPNWLSELADTLLQRADGPFLATAWLGELFHQAASEDSRGNEPNYLDYPVAGTMRDSLMAKLAEMGSEIRSRHVMPICDLEKNPVFPEGWGEFNAFLPLQLDVALEAHQDTQSAQKLEPLSERLIKLCIHRDGGIQRSFYFSKVGREFCAALLGWLYDGHDGWLLWRKHWDKLLFQRRAANRKDVPAFDEHQPSALLIWAALNMLDRRIHQGERQKSNAMFIALEEELRWLYLTRPLVHQEPPWRGQIQSLFARLPYLLPTGNENLAQSYQRLLAPYAGDIPMLSGLAVTLSLNGTTFSDLLTAFARIGNPLPDVLSDELSWNASLRAERRLNSAALQQMRELLDSAQ